jgi:hypothetical protein
MTTNNCLAAHEPLDDNTAVQNLENKIKMLKDRVAGVVHGFNFGLYAYGAGGLGKSYIVTQQLEQLRAEVRQYTSRVTAKGLFKGLSKATEAIHLIEDVERLTSDRDAQSLLRAALWAQPGRERIISWTTDKEDVEPFVFRGGIILLANRPLTSLPELRALATRITVLRMDVTDNEFAAMMRKLAAKGFARDGKTVLDPEQCGEVTEWLIQESLRAGCPLDLRLQVNCFMDYLQAEGDYSSYGWKALVTQRIQAAASHFAEEPTNLSQEERRTQRRNILAKIMRQTKDPAEQLGLYRQQTGKSKADFHRRKNEVESNEFPDTQE